MTTIATIPLEAYKTMMIDVLEGALDQMQDANDVGAIHGFVAVIGVVCRCGTILDMEKELRRRAQEEGDWEPANVYLQVSAQIFAQDPRELLFPHKVLIARFVDEGLSMTDRRAMFRPLPTEKELN